jgi:hypothetical protein
LVNLHALCLSSHYRGTKSALTLLSLAAVSLLSLCLSDIGQSPGHTLKKDRGNMVKEENYSNE